MRLGSLELRNFRGFKELRIDFHPHVTVLIGVNGSGKTTILDAIELMLRGAIRLDHSTGMTARDVRNESDETRIALELDQVPGEPRVKIVGGFAGGRQEGIQRPTLIATEEEHITGPLPVLCYYRVNRHATDATPGSTNPGVWPASSAWRGALDESAVTFQSLFHWFREREDLENEERRDVPDYRDPQLEAVRRGLTQLLPGYSTPRVRRPRFGNSSSSSSIDRPVLAITKNGEELSFDQLSEGERTMAALVCDISRRLAIANPDADCLKGDGVVLIDEVDLHLHPEWQANAIPALRRTFPNLQFVVTTHSSIVLGYVPSECVRVLSDFALFDRPTPTQGRDPNSIYTDLFGIRLRPADVEEQLSAIASLIDRNDLDEARQQLDLLRDKLGADDREITRLTTLVEMLED
jgi:predicted ATPase